MKNKQIWFNTESKTLSFKQTTAQKPPSSVLLLPETSNVVGYYDNALIGLFYAKCILSAYSVNKITIQQKFVEIDFETTEKIIYQNLKRLEKFSDDIFKKFNWKQNCYKKLEIIFKNWSIVKGNNYLEFDNVQLNLNLLKKTKINNYSTFQNKNKKKFHRLQIKIPSEISTSLLDHREINKTLKIFDFVKQIGSGLPFWLPKGESVKHEIKNYLRRLEKKNGFIFITTPIMANKKIYELSGHWAHYQNFMFPAMKCEHETLMLRPMTCPHHCMFFASEIRSYLDLPLRVSENSALFRYESSGSLSGLERTRQMELKDSHIFLEKNTSQIKKEIQKYYYMTQTALKAMGIEIKSIYLSVHDAQESTKYYNDPKLWKETESILQKGLKEINVDFKIMKGEAAFYGPKIDFQINTALGHDITISTIQLDFLLPERFKLEYRTAEQTKEKRTAQPIIIHHGIIGTYERLISIMLEKNNGWLPFWLSPIQVAIIFLQHEQKIFDYGKKIYDLLNKHDIKIKIMSIKKTLNTNIKKLWTEKIPFHVYIGKIETNEQNITFYDNYQKKIKFEHISALQLLDRCSNLIANNL